MKHITLLLLAVCVFIITITQAYSQIPPTGLVAHLPFTGNANDISGNAHHGNTHNVVLTAGLLASGNTAYQFDSAINTYITIPFDSGLNMNSAISMCAVFKPSKFYKGLCQGNYIFARGHEGTSGSYKIEFMDNPYNSCSAMDTNFMVIGTSMGTVLLPISTFQSSSKIHTNNWYCVVVTLNAGVCKIYVNGVLANSSSGWTSSIGASADSLSIGKYLWAGSTYPYNFSGVMDDIALYNRALTDTEIAEYCINAPLEGVEIPDTPNSINYHTIINTIKLYPNPNSGSFVIDGNLPSGKTNIEIHNMIGSVLYRNSVNTENNSIHQNVDISNLPRGMYLLKISGDNYSGNIRFIKQE